MSQSTFAFFGRKVRVEADSSEVLAVLDLVYERQRLPDLHSTGDAAPAGADAVVRILSLGKAGPRIEVGSRTVRVPSAEQLAHYAHLVLVNVAAAGVEQSIVLHAGAVVRDGRAVVLVGASGWGKSTLTLELTRRGWGLLSDDFALVRRDGVVEPFHRRVNLTEASLELLDVQAPDGSIEVVGFAGRSKWMIDVDALFPGCLGHASPLATVFVLSPVRRERSSGGAANAKDVSSSWTLVVDHLPPGFEQALVAAPEVAAIEVRAEPGSTAVIAVTANPGARVVRSLDAVCAEFDVAVLGASQGLAGEPRFDSRPEAAPLTAEEARSELLTHTVSLSGKRFVEGTSSAAVLAAANLVHDILVDFHGEAFRVTPGLLAQTADLVERLAGR